MTQPLGTEVRASQIESDALTGCWDTQDVDAVIENIGTAALEAQSVDPSEVTAAMVEVGEGEYTQVWVCDSSRPWDFAARFIRVL